MWHVDSQFPDRGLNLWPPALEAGRSPWHLLLMCLTGGNELWGWVEAMMIVFGWRDRSLRGSDLLYLQEGEERLTGDEQRSQEA